MKSIVKSESITVTSVEDAWALADRLFPTDYVKDEQASANAGYSIYSAPHDSNRIADLSARLELTLGTRTINIWIAKKTLETILEAEKVNRREDGDFGIRACKESIKMTERLTGKGLYEQLENYVERANRDKFFNRAMVLACWELINGKE